MPSALKQTHDTDILINSKNSCNGVTNTILPRTMISNTNSTTRTCSCIYKNYTI